MEYLTDGTNLYEVVAEDIFHNAGCNHGDAGSLIREAALRDCVTGEVALVGHKVLAKLRKVCEMDEQADSKSVTT